MKKVMKAVKGYAKGGAVGGFKVCAACKNPAACAKMGKCAAQGMAHGGKVKARK
jgi:hypothetical protein